MGMILANILLLGTIFGGLLTNFPTSIQQVSLNHITAGFSIDSVARVDNAASLGVNTAFIYGTPFTPSDPTGAEMQAKGVHEVDAGLASQLFYYECHRTHTVAPPPSGAANNYCATDSHPSLDSENALLAAIDAKLQADAANSLIVGYWVLDDWPLWDSGSAKIVLQDIHSHIVSHTPSYPAICGFGLIIDKPTSNDWLPELALNYSNGGCDMIGIYSYVGRYPSKVAGSQFDFSMKLGLASAFQSLQQQGWNESNTPLIGIGQAFAGLYGGTRYEPGITSSEMQTQATAFCHAGASSIGWYAWDDSGFGNQTLQPTTSAKVQKGIKGSIGACQGIWTTPKS